MTPAGGGWESSQLAEFLAELTSASDEASAVRRGIEWAAEAMEAEFGAIVEGGRVTASVGFPMGQVPEALLLEVIEQRAEELVVDTVGRCRVLIAPFESDADGGLLIGRLGDAHFSREEANLLRAMARSLTLTLHVLKALDRERILRAALQERQVLLERLSEIQRSISRRAPLREVLDAITNGARELLGDEVAALRLLDSDDRQMTLLASSAGLPSQTVTDVQRSPVGWGAGGRAITEERLVVLNDYGQADDVHDALVAQGLKSAMAAPVRDGDRVVGAIVVASMKPGRQYGQAEQDILDAFAEHASLALADAKTVDAMQHLAFHDALTGLPNRTLFFERLDQALARARRDRSRAAVLFLDLDRFKTVNDSLGHAAGDRLLIAVSERLRACLREADTAARLGGDEFAILIEEHEGTLDATTVADRIIEAMGAPFDLDGAEVSMSASIGIAMSALGKVDAGTMLRDADLAMYRAKLDGSGRFFSFEPGMHSAAMERLQLEGDLRRALERNEFVLHYQPVVDLRTEEVRSVEALVRWAHPTRGLVAPMDFIPLAEDTGLIVSIGRWVLGEAVRQVRAWQRAHPAAREMGVSVNLSARQVRDPDLVNQVRDVLATQSFDPTLLTLEITETALMRDTDAAAACLQELKTLGVRLALDDFGTGYSSLGHLLRFPIDCLKVDKSFVAGISEPGEQASVGQAIIALGKTLGLETIAEGIETSAHVDALRNMHCDLGQGFFLSYPLAPQIMDRYLADNEAHCRAAALERSRSAALVD